MHIVGWDPVPNPTWEQGDPDPMDEPIRLLDDIPIKRRNDDDRYDIDGDDRQHRLWTAEARKIFEEAKEDLEWEIWWKQTPAF